MIGVAIAWVPVVKETQGGQVFIYIQEISAYFAPPVAMIFMLGIFWHPCNEQVNLQIINKRWDDVGEGL